MFFETYISFLTLLVCTLGLLETLLYGLIFCLCLTVNDLLYEGIQIRKIITLKFGQYIENRLIYLYEILTRPYTMAIYCESIITLVPFGRNTLELYIKRHNICQ